MNKTQAVTQPTTGSGDTTKAEQILDTIENLNWTYLRLSRLLDKIIGQDAVDGSCEKTPRAEPSLQHLLINGADLINDKMEIINARITDLESILTT